MASDYEWTICICDRKTESTDRLYESKSKHFGDFESILVCLFLTAAPKHEPSLVTAFTEDASLHLSRWRSVKIITFVKLRIDKSKSHAFRRQFRLSFNCRASVPAIHGRFRSKSTMDSLTTQPADHGQAILRLTGLLASLLADRGCLNYEFYLEPIARTCQKYQYNTLL